MPRGALLAAGFRRRRWRRSYASACRKIRTPSIRHRARTYVSRIRFAVTSLCDKLIDIDEKLHSCRSWPQSWSLERRTTQVLTFKLRTDAVSPSTAPGSIAAPPPRPTWTAP